MGRRPERIIEHGSLNTKYTTYFGMTTETTVAAMSLRSFPSPTTRS